MIAEFRLGNHYESSRLVPGGQACWLSLLAMALTNYDDYWLAKEAHRLSIFASVENRKTRNGFRTVKVPENAPQTLAEGEFNHYYLRGIASRAINANKTLRIYRGKFVDNPRWESEAMIGSTIDPRMLLAQLRTSPHDVFGPGSGLTCEIT